MEGCQCLGSIDRPPCSIIDTNRLKFDSHDDLTGLIFNRASIAKLFAFDNRCDDNVVKTEHNGFCLFPALPSELRLKIWSFALSIPRLIVVSYTTATGEDDRRVFVDTPPVPPCLFVCHESRKEALKAYVKCTITSLPGSPVTYVNFAIDQFLLGGPDADLDIDYLLSITTPETSHRVRFLHLSKGCWKGFARWAPLKERFTGVEKLVMSFPDGAACLPYTHECWYGMLARDQKEVVVKSELCEEQDDDGNVAVWHPQFQLKLIHYDSAPIEGMNWTSQGQFYHRD